MSAKPEKLTIVLPRRLYGELERTTRELGRSVGDLVRDATEIQYGLGGVAARLRAVEIMAGLDAPIAGPENIEKHIEKGALERRDRFSRN